MCPTQNKTSGELAYPDVDVDKTAVLQKQMDGLEKNVKDVFTFRFSFKRPTEAERKQAEVQECDEKRLVEAKKRIFLDVDEVVQGCYNVTIKMTVKQALGLIVYYTGSKPNCEVHRTYVVKTDRGKEVVNFPKHPTKEHPQTPRAGICFQMYPAKCPKIKKSVRSNVPHVPKQTPLIKISHEFDITPRYTPGWHANPDEYFVIRLGLWHEIMEMAILSLLWKPCTGRLSFITSTMSMTK